MNKEPARTVMLIIAVDSVDELHEFYTEKLGFDRVMGVVGKDGQFDFVTVVLGGARIMFSRAQERMDGTRPSASKRPVRIYLEVEDVNLRTARFVLRHVRQAMRNTDKKHFGRRPRTSPKVRFWDTRPLASQPCDSSHPAGPGQQLTQFSG